MAEEYGLFLFLSEVFAVVVATLLGTLKDVVGYIFTNDKWVNSFILSIVTFSGGGIYIPEAADRVHKPLSGNRVPQGFLPLPSVAGQCGCCWHWDATAVVPKLPASPRVSRFGIRLCWLREMWQNQSPLGPACAALTDQHVRLPNREIVILVSKVVIIFAPFHLFDAVAVSIPASLQVGVQRRAQSPSWLCGTMLWGPQVVAQSSRGVTFHSTCFPVD